MAEMTNSTEMRASILERLVGDTGEPNHVIGAARSMIERVLPEVLKSIEDNLSAPVTIEIKSVEIARLTEARSTKDSDAVSIVSSPVSPDALIISADADAVAVLVSTLFGADPDLPITPIERALSPTEVEVATLAFQQIASVISGSEAAAFALNLPVPTAKSGAEFRKQVLRDGPAVRVVLSIAIPAGAGTISLTLPQRVLLKQRRSTDPIVSKAAEPATDWGARFNDEVMRSNVRLEATMLLGRMTLGELSEFAEGQIIELHEGAQSETKLSARGKPLFVCEFGKLGQNYTVRLRHHFDESQDFMDALLPEDATHPVVAS
jgi:flagellar motor switch protein FliM